MYTEKLVVMTGKLPKGNKIQKKLSSAERSQHLKECQIPVILPSRVIQGQEWQVVSTGAKRRKVLRALYLVEMRNPFSVLEGVEKEVDVVGEDEERKVGADANSQP
ncbi:hypothetical protein E2C01_036110 [Portunus trituberculatus]|uniref:Uncharacterized protein n=1 Tax=Portunus trituberculatus TaxID=210409 RepID=A0A5B7FBK3_PORTR|nr:hypothetical protein [Portunus trituberculatus]